MTENWEDVYSVKLRFTGLCTFAEKPSGKGYRVFMVDGRDVCNPGGGSSLKGLMHLAPMVLFNYNDLDLGSCQRRPDLTFEKKIDQDIRNSLCFLDREDLALEIKQGKVLAKTLNPIGGDIKNNVMPEEDAPPFSFEWMIKAEDLNQDVRLQPGCLGSSPSNVAARVDLDLGELYVEELLRAPVLWPWSTKTSLQRVRWTDPGGGEPHPSTRCVALMATCHIKFSKDEPVVVRLKSTVWPNKAGRSLSFKKLREPKKELVIEFWNVPFSDIVRCWGNRSWKPKPGFGESLQHHYTLLKNPATKWELKRHATNTKKLKFFAAAGKDVGCSPFRAPWPRDPNGNPLPE